MFQHEYSANFLFTLWKRVRKYGAFATGITQNVDDLLQSHTARTMLANSEFLIMLKKTFGLWIYKKEKEENIRCLCPKCLSEYIDNPNYIVRRLNPFAKEKDRCDKCDKAGWDYIVTERNSVRKGKSGSYEK